MGMKLSDLIEFNITACTEATREQKGRVEIGERALNGHWKWATNANDDYELRMTIAIGFW